MSKILKNKFCNHCKNDYKPSSSHQLFCSINCRIEFNSIEKQCSVCNLKFSNKREYDKQRSTCSDKCSRILGAKKTKHENVELYCLGCNKKYMEKFLKRNKKFCSVLCQTQYYGKEKTKNGILEKNCKECGKLFYYKKYRDRNIKYCSRNCLNINLAGEKNPFFGKIHDPNSLFGGGRSKWYTHIQPDGTTIRVQGTWELKFAQWMDSQNLKYKCHKQTIKYFDETLGRERNYYPDFYVFDWSCYVDIKNDYHMSLQEQKFEFIRKSNLDKNIKVLLKKDLNELGINVK